MNGILIKPFYIEMFANEFSSFLRDSNFLDLPFLWDKVFWDFHLCNVTHKSPYQISRGKNSVANHKKEILSKISNTIEIDEL